MRRIAKHVRSYALVEMDFKIESDRVDGNNMVTQVSPMHEIYLGRKIIGELGRNAAREVVNGPHTAREFVVRLKRGKKINSMIAPQCHRDADSGSITKPGQIGSGIPYHAFYATSILDPDPLPIIGNGTFYPEPVLVHPMNRQ